MDRELELSHEWSALVAGIRWQPDDDTQRMAAADWLQERDQADLRAWGQFIYADIELARWPRDHVYIDSCDCRTCRAERTTAELFDRWGRFWFDRSFLDNDGQFVAMPPLKNYRRGFFDMIVVDYRDWKMKYTPRLVRELFQLTPLMTAVVSLIEERPSYRGGPAPWKSYELTMQVPAVTYYDSPAIAIRATLRIPNGSQMVSQARYATPTDDFNACIENVVERLLRLRGELDQVGVAGRQPSATFEDEAANVPATEGPTE